MPSIVQVHKTYKYRLYTSQHDVRLYDAITGLSLGLFKTVVNGSNS